MQECKKKKLIQKIISNQKNCSPHVPHEPKKKKKKRWLYLKANCGATENLTTVSKASQNSAIIACPPIQTIEKTILKNLTGRL